MHCISVIPNNSAEHSLLALCANAIQILKEMLIMHHITSWASAISTVSTLRKRP
jgi:uncharacterized protein YqgV (UPF0045/DUF77 family)